MTRAQIANAFMEEFQDELLEQRTRWYCRNGVSLSEYYRINKLIFIQFAVQKSDSDGWGNPVPTKMYIE